MKVRCVDCKKRFDYELYSGVCPKCGNYMRPPEMETSQNVNCDVEGSHVHTDSAQEGYTATYAQEEYTETYAQPEPAPRREPESSSDYAKPEKKKKSNPVLTVMLVAAIVLVGAGTAIFLFISQNQVHKELTVQEELAVRNLTQEDTIEYRADSNLYEITIESLTVDEDPAFNLPDQYEAIVLSYRIERTFLGGEGIDYDSFHEIRLTPYLETVSGHFLKPVSEYSIRKVKGIENYEQADEMGLGEKFEHKQGILYYFVKKDDIKRLHITSADYDRENYRSGALREIFCIDGLEVTR
nr:hypothetical protein [Lachnospiraceae bacterium]